MRTQLFIIGLIALSCVAATQTTFQQKLAEQEYASKIEQMKSQNNMGSIIMSMAELTTDQGRFTALFNAIDDATKFLVHDKKVEDQSFGEATALFHQTVTRLTKERNHAQRLYKADNANLNNHLYPQRKSLIKLIARLEASLKNLKQNLFVLRANRAREIKVFQQRSSDYANSIQACKQALPILKSLVNGQSFAEIDADVFAQVSGSLKSTLGKLEMGSLYTVFVESMVQSLKMQNFVNQEGLIKVIKQIENLQERLEHGSVALKSDEALNKKNFHIAQAKLQKAIAYVTLNLATNEARLVALVAKIAAVEKHRDIQVAIYKARVASLIIVNEQYIKRTHEHNVFIKENRDELATIAEAVRLLSEGGVTRNA